MELQQNKQITEARVQLVLRVGGGTIQREGSPVGAWSQSKPAINKLAHSEGQKERISTVLVRIPYLYKLPSVYKCFWVGEATLT